MNKSVNSKSNGQNKEEPSNARLSKKAFDYVVENITSGELKPSVRITERQLAKALDISHVPIREAMEKLEHEGWIERIPQKGARVRRIDQKELEMLFEIREIIETGAIHLLIEKITVKQISELNEFENRLEQALSENNPDEFIEADTNFHLSLVKFTCNTRLFTYFNSIIQQSRYSSPVFLLGALKTVFSMKTDLNNIELTTSHKKILKAITSKKASLAADLLRKHIRCGYKLIKAVDNLKQVLIS